MYQLTQNYGMVGSIPHAIAFDMCHVVCKGIPYDHGLWFLAIWYAFFAYVVSIFKTTETFSLGYLKFRNDENHGRKRKPNVCVAWGHTPLIRSFTQPFMWSKHSNLWGMAQSLTHSFGFLLGHKVDAKWMFQTKVLYYAISDNSVCWSHLPVV